MINPWNKIFEHDFKEAYKIANENYITSASSFELRARAIASLLLKNYNNALDDFLLLCEIEKQPNPIYNTVSDGTYMQIGLCYYALGDVENAVYYFKYPIVNKKEMRYTSDISVPPCVLLFIGLKLERQDIVKIAVRELKKRKTIIPPYLLDLSSEIEHTQYFEKEDDETLRNRNQCKAEFYKAIHYLQIGLDEEYKNKIKRCVELTSNYLEFAYHIAKVEYDVYLSAS